MTPSTSGAERVWMLAAGSPAGPYTPLPGQDSITFFGGWLAISNHHGIDVSSIPKENTGLAYDLVGGDGHVWAVRWSGGFYSAFRDRTEKEMVQWVDSNNEMISVSIPKDRMIACRWISQELYRLVEAMRPERGTSRDHRRSLKRRMQTLTQLQIELLFRLPITMDDVRSRMADLGLPMAQKDFWAPDETAVVRAA